MRPNNKQRRPDEREPRPRAEIELPLVSLLWPGGNAPKPAGATSWEADLGLNDVIGALALSGRYTPYIKSVLTTLISDLDTIGWRQAVMRDFLNNPALIEQVAALLPKLASLGQGSALLGKRQRNVLLETADRLAELEAYVGVVRDLHNALSADEVGSPALLQLRDHLAALIAEPNFQTLEQELPDLRAPLGDIRSLTIGINLDVELKPESAALLSINDYKFSDHFSWLERVIGARANPNDESGIAPLHYTPEDPNMRPLSPLFQDMDRLLSQVATPVSKALSKYARTATGSLAHLEYELAFFAGAARLFTRLGNYCLPEAAPPDERVIDIHNLLNSALALRGTPVPSDTSFDERGRIAVLTGPNSGGKTTYVRGVGLAVVLFQAGLPVLAERARISPVDAILTHFPVVESRQTGRLEEEAARLRTLFQTVTRYSLVLLNETFSSTTSGEAAYLAQDMLAALRAIGARVVYATHLTELAEHLDEIEQMTEGSSKLFSLVAKVNIGENGEVQPTYRIERGLPHGRSSVRDIARKHGISLEQILAARNGTESANQ
jgi:hypothetical protein